MSYNLLRIVSAYKNSKTLNWGITLNIYDIAKASGVSIATISRVINSKCTVSIKTREKVEKILEEYNYVPNHLARGLVLNSIKTVGIITMDIRDVYYANVSYIIEQELSKLDYNVILCNTGEDIAEKKKYITSLIQKKSDGIFLVGSVFTDENLKALLSEIALKIPIIMVNGYMDVPNIYSIMCDDKRGIEIAVEYLIESGRENIVYFKDVDTYSAKQKLQGFYNAMKSSKNDFVDRVLNIEKSIKGGYDGVLELLNKNIKMDAIICGDDITAIGTIKALHQNNLNIPKDVAVIGFNNSILAQCSEPELTSIDNKMELMGIKASKIFNKLVRDESCNHKTIIKPEIIKRFST